MSCPKSAFSQHFNMLIFCFSIFDSGGSFSKYSSVRQQHINKIGTLWD